MSKSFARFDQEQYRIEVAQNAQDNNLVAVWFYALAAVTAVGAFYFWYYFWGSPWGAF